MISSASSSSLLLDDEGRRLGLDGAATVEDEEGLAREMAGTVDDDDTASNGFSVSLALFPSLSFLGFNRAPSPFFPPINTSLAPLSSCSSLTSDDDDDDVDVDVDVDADAAAAAASEDCRRRSSTWRFLSWLARAAEIDFDRLSAKPFAVSTRH